eukprot:XP_016655896.1 PREDICTED: uncharacterized protein LOC107882274 [Acyrthosiphon pisum]
MHNYYKANVEDCVLYYICGYITKNLTKQIKCNDCLTVITGKKTYSDIPEATFLNLKSRGGLIYPNEFIFRLLVAVVNSFVKHCENNIVFLLTIDDFFNNNKSIDFPCNIHKKEVLSHIVSNFIIMRMRQYSLINNKNKPKMNAKKKKLLNFDNMPIEIICSNDDNTEVVREEMLASDTVGITTTSEESEQFELFTKDGNPRKRKKYCTSLKQRKENGKT